MRKSMKERNFRTIDTNGICLRVVVEGRGPLLILLHGFPQCWYLWRHQIDPLVNAGYRVAVPDQRGYGGSDTPEAIDAYNIIELAKDVVGIADALGERQFTLVTHDWGALLGWYVALLHPRRVKAVAGMSVPHVHAPIGAFTKQENFGDRFQYTVYFQQPGVAEAEFEADLAKSLRTIYYAVSGDAPVGLFLSQRPASAKMLDGMIDPDPLPAWLTQEDLDYYVAQYRRSGFRGPINWYRNIDRDMELTRHLEGATITQPSFFIAGTKDPIRIMLAAAIQALDANLTDLRGKVFVEGAGHWVQMERPAEVNTALLGFLTQVA
jgi:pimeloyl-ACP methyl ester carboxylesterase